MGSNSSAYSQAGANSQYNLGDPSSAISLDVPAPGALATGSGSASALGATGSSSASGYIPGAIAGFDTATGRASMGGQFEITGTTGTVNVTFSSYISGMLDLSSDIYGVFGQGESDFVLSVNGNPVLFNDQILSIGPSQSQNANIGQTLTATISLMANTPYSFVGEADSEITVVNSSVPVPEPGEVALIAGGLAMLALFSRARRRSAAKKVAKQGLLVLLGGALLGFSESARATYLGSDRPDQCPVCGAQPTRQPAGAVSTSLSEGNVRDDYPVAAVSSAYGVTLPFSLNYNSYNADGSKVQLDTGLGFGWTHSYNTLLFQQRGQMFQLGADGRVTQFYQNYGGPGVSYTSDTGYFETMIQLPDGSFMVTNKFKSWWHYGAVPNTPFLVAGPVYRLLQMGDRNQNTNTMSYNAGGLLTSVTDTYGRTIQFTYDASNHLSSVTDPLGRVTTFQYDAMDRMPIQITDPLGNVTRYTYNSQYQMTEKVDRDGRMYFYTYKNQHPFMVTDGNGQPWFSMSNPENWAVDQTNLTYTLRRQYIPGTTYNTDGNGNVWQYAYDTNGYITQATAPDGATTRYTYDPGSLNVASVTDANGHATTYQYDGNGNRTQMTDALGEVTTYTYDPIFNQVTSMTDPNGRTTTYSYDATGNKILETDALGQTQTWTYDSHGDILTYTDKRANTTTYTYDALGELIKSTDALGDVTTYTYDAVGNRLSMTDANSHITTYTYDGDNRLIMTTDALGHTNTTAYDGAGNIISRTDADGRTTTYVYDQRTRLIATTNALGGVTQTTYDPDDNILSRTDANGRVTTYQYDSQNRVINQTDPLGNISRTTYDLVGNRLSLADADGNITTYQYDALNRRVGETDPLGNVTTYQYASIGGMPCCGATAGSDLLTGTVDPDGKYTYYHYDELNRRVQVVHKSGTTTDTNTPSDAITTTVYDADDNHIAVIDPNGNTIRMEYDALNRQIAITNGAGDVSTTSYDPVGNMIETVDPRGNITIYTYDAVNRLIQTTDSGGLVSSATYDPVGNVISSIDGNGHTTVTTYDALNRPILVTDPLGNTTTTAYDPVGNMLDTTDRNGRTTTYTYDAVNRRTNATDALGDTRTTVYDAVGNVTSIIDPLDRITTYTYDADNRRIQETYPDSPSDTMKYSYDPSGHLILCLDPNGQTTAYGYNDFYYTTNRQFSTGPNDMYTYDLAGRLTNSVRGPWTNNYSYDAANRMITSVHNGRIVSYIYIIPTGIRIIAYPGGSIMTESNDLRSRLVLVNNGGSPALTQYTYDLNNSVLIRTNRNGTLTTYTYNPNDWVTNLIHSNSTGFFAGHSYAYDNEGNRSYAWDQARPAASELYTYDAINRLTNFDVGTPSGGIIPSPTLAEGYNLDAVGNWTTLTSNAVPQLRIHNSVNEITSINGNPLSYDRNGNLTNDGRYAYTYDVQNRVTALTRISDSALVGQYFYDASGCRVLSIIDPGGTPVTNSFFYDGGRIIEVQDPGGATQATYTYGGYVDGVITMNRGGQTYYYHPNDLFSVEALTDSSGTPVERYSYDVYGQPTVMDGSYNPLPLNAWGTPHSAVGNFYLFTGRQLDEESGIYYYRARYYDPAKGRFIQRDPLDYIDGLNLYEYVGDEPTRFTDPSGLHYIAGSLTMSCPVKCNGETIGSLQANRDLFYHRSRGGDIGYALRNANGVGIAIDFKSAMGPFRRPCCCDRFRFLQVVRANQAKGKLGDQSFVDVGNDTNSPFYDENAMHGTGRHPRPPGYMQAGTNVTTDISIYDRPYRDNTDLAGLGEDFTWRAEACLVCVKNRPAKDVILQCITYGFDRNRNNNGTFGPAWGVGPECGGSGGSANFRQTINAWAGGKYKAGQQFE